MTDIWPMIFINALSLKNVCFVQISFSFVLEGSLKIVSIGLDKGFVPGGHQTIIWTNDATISAYILPPHATKFYQFSAVILLW